MKEENLIFIISQPRSGSTLLQSILANHDQISSRSEHWLLLPYVSIFKPQLYNALYHSQTANLIFQRYLDENSLLHKFKKDLIDFFKKQYTYISNNTEVFVLDKTPRYYEILDILPEMFPNAKIIILKRNPLDVMLSLIEKKNKESLKLIEFNYRDLLYAPRIIHEFCVKNSNNPKVKVIKYENLAIQTTKEINEILEWLNLDFQDNLLEFHKSEVLNDKVGDQKIFATDEVMTTSLDRWKKVKSSFEKNMIYGYYNYLGKYFLNKYGYQNINIKCQPNRLFNFYVEFYNPFSKFESSVYKCIKQIMLKKAFKKYL